MNIYFYTKNGCPLCDSGLVDLKNLQAQKKFKIIVRDIYTNDNWLEKYQIRIPVIEKEDGVVLDEGMVSYETLAKNYNLSSQS